MSIISFGVRQGGQVRPSHDGPRHPRLDLVGGADRPIWRPAGAGHRERRAGLVVGQAVTVVQCSAVQGRAGQCSAARSTSPADHGVDPVGNSRVGLGLGITTDGDEVGTAPPEPGDITEWRQS